MTTKETSMLTTTTGLPLQHGAFAKPPLHIPDAHGRPYKTESVLVRTPERTEKINHWHLPDVVRGGEGGRMPHNHPHEDADGISFRSTVMHGAITHAVYWIEEVPGASPEDAINPVEMAAGAVAKVMRMRTETWRAGETYSVRYDEYHLVTYVEPGTVTHMVCGPSTARDGDPGWGYLNNTTGEYRRAAPDPEFLARLRACNPFMRAP